MSGTKKTIFISLGVIILLALMWFLIQKFNLGKKHPDPLKALPGNMIAFYSGDDFGSEFNKISRTAFWKNLSTHANINSLTKQFARIDTFLSSDQDAGSFINNQKMILSLHKTSTKALSVLFLMQTKGRFEAHEIQEVLEKELQVQATIRVFENCDIYDFQATTKHSVLAFALVDGILAVSKSPILVEDAVRTYHANNKLINEEAHPFSSTNLKNDWFINFSALDEFLSIFTSPAIREQLQSANYFARQGSYELTYNDESFSLRGSLAASDSFAGFSSLFIGQKPGKTELAKIASSKTAMLNAYCINNWDEYGKRYKAYLQFSHQWDKYEAVENRFRKDFPGIIDQKIPTLLNGHFALSLHEPFHEDLSKSKLLYVGSEQAKELGALLQHSYSDSNSINNFSFLGYPVYETNKAEALYLLLGKNFDIGKRAYFAIIRNFLVFSRNLSLLKKVIADYSDGNSLYSSADYHRFANRLVSESNFFSYINPVRLNAISDFYLGKNWNERNTRNSVFNKLEVLGYQIVNNKNGLYNELIATFSASATQTIEKIWEVELDTSFSRKPYIFKNHNTKKWEVLVFDDKNTLYLISTDGEILWKRPLNSPLVGDVYQVDFYKNKKLQYLFCTESHLQLIDRLGRNTSNYPIRLGAKAVTGIGLYQRSKTDVRYFVGTENEKVFGYNLSGQPMNGWSPRDISGKLSFPIRYFIRENKIQFFGITDNGHFYRWDFKGQQNNKNIDLQTTFVSPLQMRFGIQNEDTYLTSIDTAGNTYFINLADEVEVHRFGNFSKNVYFDYLDINADKEKDLIFVDQTSFLAFSKEGEILLSVALEAVPDYQPELLMLDDKYHIAYVNKEQKKLYLVNLQGVPDRNFPVAANTAFSFFDMNGDGKAELIAGEDNRLFLSRF
jgi:hypothetical protein